MKDKRKTLVKIHKPIASILINNVSEMTDEQCIKIYRWFVLTVKHVLKHRNGYSKVFRAKFLP